MSTYQQMLDAGVECSNHESDLYVPVNDITTKIKDGYRFSQSVTTFHCGITGELMYDFPFAYDPFWIKKGFK